MKQAMGISVLTAAALLLSGCVTTNASLLGATASARPALLPNQVALYRIASQVPGQYEEVALLNSTGDSGFTDEAKMFASMKKKAGELGANGVILDAVSEPGAGAKVAAAIFGVSAQRKGKAIAIYVIPGSTAPNSQPEPTQPRSASPSNCVACEKIGKDL